MGTRLRAWMGTGERVTFDLGIHLEYLLGFGRLKKEDYCEFQASQGCIGILRPAWVTWEHCFNKQAKGGVGRKRRGEKEIDMNLRSG